MNEGEEAGTLSFRDASTQVNDWQSFSNDELQYELAFRLRTPRFALTMDRSIPLVRDYDRRGAYKQWNAVYDCDDKLWYYPPGTDLRSVLYHHPEWMREPDLLRITVLLRLIKELENSPTLRS